MSGKPHRNFAVKELPGTGAICAAIWRSKIYWNKSHRAMAVQLFQCSVVGSGLRRSWPWKGHRAPADGPSRSALIRSWVLKAKPITLTQPESFAFSSRRAAKPRNSRTAKLRCGLPDIAGDRPSAGMISGYCDFTMSSTFSATGQLLDLKRAGDRKLARLRRRFGVHAGLASAPAVQGE